MNKGLETKLN